MKKTPLFAYLALNAFLLVLVAVPAFASDGIAITNGLWRMTSTTAMPMMPQPQVTKSEECMNNRTFSPKDLTDNSGGCQLSDVAVAGNTMSWKMVCAGQGGMGASTGKGRMTVNKTTAEGGMDIDMSMGAQSMKMTVKWQGERIGDCK